MMKNLLLTTFTALIFSASFGQYDLQVVMSSPTTGSTFRSTNSTMTITIKNNGTNTIPSGDTMYVYTSYGTQLRAFTSGNAGFVSVIPLASALAPGSSTTAMSSALINLSTYPTTSTQINVCSYAYLKNSADTDSTNNSACYTWDLSTVSTPEITLEKSTKVFVAHGVLNMSSTATENLTYTVVSLTGQVISQGNFVSNKQVDMNGAAKGMYAVIITNGTQKVTRKVIVQ